MLLLTFLWLNQYLKKTYSLFIISLKQWSIGHKLLYGLYSKLKYFYFLNYGLIFNYKYWNIKMPKKSIIFRNIML